MTKPYKSKEQNYFIKDEPDTYDNHRTDNVPDHFREVD